MTTWETPKTDWDTNDGIGYADLNRIEENVSAVRDATVRGVQGFNFTVDNSQVGYDGVVTIGPGSCYSANGIPMKSLVSYTKNLTSWVAGSGNDKGGMAPAVTVAAHTWYYIFMISNPATGLYDFMIDDDPAGANISSGTYPQKRYVNAIKTNAAGDDGSFDLVEMFSVGNYTYINPNSNYSGREGGWGTSVVGNNVYTLQTLEFPLGEGLAFPARAVRADLNLYSLRLQFYGFISAYGGVFTVPANLFPSTVPDSAIADFLGGVNYDSGTSALLNTTAEMSIMLPASGQVYVALYKETSEGSIFFAARGFYDERLI